jgi:hypothetical protein
VEPGAEVDRVKLAARVRNLERQRVAFDPLWDFDDRSKLFCTELVAEALLAGGGAVPAVEPLNPNPSLRRVLSWLGASQETSLPAGTFAARGRTVAVFSRWPTRAAAAGYFAAKAELHRRFTPDQKVGNLMVLDGQDVALRPEVEAFLDRATALYPAARREEVPPAEEVEDRVRRLADELFGPWPRGPALVVGP